MVRGSALRLHAPVMDDKLVPWLTHHLLDWRLAGLLGRHGSPFRRSSYCLEVNRPQHRSITISARRFRVCQRGWCGDSRYALITTVSFYRFHRLLRVRGPRVRLDWITFGFFSRGNALIRASGLYSVPSRFCPGRWRTSLAGGISWSDKQNVLFRRWLNNF